MTIKLPFIFALSGAFLPLLTVTYIRNCTAAKQNQCSSAYIHHRIYNSIFPVCNCGRYCQLL